MAEYIEREAALRVLCDACGNACPKGLIPRCSYYENMKNGESFKPITNADRIRAMTDEELAYFMANIEPCRESAWLDWLKAEVTE